MNIIEFHYTGGLIWMATLSFIFIVNIVLLVRVALRHMNRKEVTPKSIELIKQLGGFALAFGAYSTLVAFFQAFRDISKSNPEIPWQVIAGGLQVALITVLYGFVIFLITIVALIGIGFLKKD